MKRRGAKRSRSGSTFSCGHPRVPENTRTGRGRGRSWGRCRICNNNYMRAYMRRRARERLKQRAAKAERELRALRAKLLS